jgi:hypothetical protein
MSFDFKGTKKVITGIPQGIYLLLSLLAFAFSLFIICISFCEQTLLCIMPSIAMTGESAHCPKQATVLMVNSLSGVV